MSESHPPYKSKVHYQVNRVTGEVKEFESSETTDVLYKGRGDVTDDRQTAYAQGRDILRKRIMALSETVGKLEMQESEYNKRTRPRMQFIKRAERMLAGYDELWQSDAMSNCGYEQILDVMYNQVKEWGIVDCLEIIEALEWRRQSLRSKKR